MHHRRGRLDRARRTRLTPVVAILAWLALGSSALADHSRVELLSTGPTGGNGPYGARIQGASEDVSRVFFETAESLVPADHDTALDVYERNGATTRLVSAGSIGGNGSLDARFEATTPDGDHVVFSTAERLVAADTDSSGDLYLRSGATTSLVSTGPTAGYDPGISAFVKDPELLHISADGRRVLFRTGEHLVAEDVDRGCIAYDPELEEDRPVACFDVYERVDGTTKLVSTGPAGGAGPHQAEFVGASDDGSRVFFGTDEPLVAADDDNTPDIYESSQTATTLVSGGAGGTSSNFGSYPVDRPGVPFWPSPQVRPVSADGSSVFFHSFDRLTPDDPDHSKDLYRRSGDTTILVTRQPPGAAPVPSNISRFYAGSEDGSRAYFGTNESLVPRDTDGGQVDIYEWDSRTLALLTPGPVGRFPEFEGVSADGRRLFYQTDQRVTSEDRDTVEDIYVYRRPSGTTTLVSTGPVDNPPSCCLIFMDMVGISRDGGRAFFITEQPLVSVESPDSPDFDIYERFQGRTTLISTGPRDTAGRATVNPFGPIVPVSRDGRRVAFGLGYDPFDFSAPLVDADTDTEGDVYAASMNSPPDCSAVAADPAHLSRDRALHSVVLQGAADPDGDPVTFEVTGVTQDEPLTGPGDKTSPDALHTSPPGAVLLRAERSPKGDGRVYQITYRASDGRGGECSGTATVEVLRKKNHAPAVDSSPPAYDSFGG
jgi:hypothetical protein